MNGNDDTRNAAKRRAQNHFTASEERDSAIKQEIERARAATNALIVKQRAARLAREAEDKSAAEAMGVLFPALPKKRKKRQKSGT